MFTKKREIATCKRDIATYIREGRRKANMTQRVLAEKLGVSVATISKWENEEKVPSGDKLLKIIDLLDIAGFLFPDYAKRQDLELDLESKELMQEIGNRLLILRKNKKLTQKKAADIAGVNENYISQVENGKKLLGAFPAKDLCKKLDIDVNYFTPYNGDYIRHLMMTYDKHLEEKYNIDIDEKLERIQLQIEELKREAQEDKQAK